MKIVFALIWLLNGSHESRIPVKVGEYEKYSQCKSQGEFLAKLYQFRYDTYQCLGVNATGR